jgi:hypothetical protein
VEFKFFSRIIGRPQRRMFEKKMLRGVFGPKGEETAGGSI